MDKCIVKGCIGTSQLVKFPRHKRMCEEWLKQLKEPRIKVHKHVYVYKYYRLCIDHFEEKYFEKLTAIPKKLLPNAIPTLNMSMTVKKSDSDLNDSNYIDIGKDFQTCFTNEYKRFKILYSPNLHIVLWKSIIRMPPRNRVCILQFDFLSIRSKVENKYPTIGKIKVLVFMLRGLFENWKQLLAYLYIDNNIPVQILAEYICDAIYSALSLHVNISAVICAPDSLNIQAMDLISSNHNRIYCYPYKKFEFIPFPGHKSILILYDVPRLLINLRQEFMFMNIYFKIDYKNYIASWEDIEIVHEHRKKEKCQLLTDEHVYLSKMYEKSVHHAAQVFSNTVSESLLDYADKHLEEYQPTMKGTSKFISFFNDLFDSLNGYQYTAPKHKPLYKKVRRATDHFLIWQKSAKYLESMRFILPNGERKRTTTLEKWESTIYGIMELWNCLLTMGFHEFVPRRLNMDALDNDLSRIRYHHYNVEGMKWNASEQMKRQFYPDIEEFDSGFSYVLENGANFLTPLYSTFLSPRRSTRSDLDFENNSDESKFNCLEDNCSTIVTISDFIENTEYCKKLLTEIYKKFAKM